MPDDQKAGQEAELVLALDGFAQVDGQRLCNDKVLRFVTQLIQRQQHWESSCQVTNDGLSFRYVKQQTFIITTRHLSDRGSINNAKGVFKA